MQSRSAPLVALVAASLAVLGCGQAPQPPPKPHAVRPVDTPCADLSTRTAAHRLARKLVDRVVAPDGQSERQTIGIIGESLYATCRQPRMPGVSNMRDYRPVKTVLAAVQRDFDEEAISGG